MNLFTRANFHKYVYLAGLLTIAIALPLSLFVMTVGITTIFINSILEWNWKEKWERIQSNRTLLWLISFPLLLGIWLIHSDHLQTGLQSLLLKLPLLIIPLVIATTNPLKKSEIDVILLAFVSSLVVTTSISVYYLWKNPIHDIREISRFISHIRFSLNIVMGIVIILFLIRKKAFNTRIFNGLLIIIALWLTAYLFISQTLTGIAILLILGIIFFTSYLFEKQKNRVLIWVFFTSMVLFFVYLGVITFNYFEIKNEGGGYPSHTRFGNPYYHDTLSLVENGSRIGVNICEIELIPTWEMRSELPYDSVKHGLIRYLNSKGLTKDREGVLALTEKDLKNIEMGYANVAYTEGFGLKRSLYPTFFSISLYHKYGILHQSSLLERVELWKNSWQVIQKHPWVGVGLGDHKKALDQQLEQSHSQITKKEKGCHNQFLTVCMTGGIILLTIFVLYLAAPFFTSGKRSLLYFLFFILIFMSMLTEDTLDTHAGVTFFAFFNSLILFVIEPLLIHNKKGDF